MLTERLTNVLPASLQCQAWLFPPQAGGTVPVATEPVQTMGLKTSSGLGQSVVIALHYYLAYTSRPDVVQRIWCEPSGAFQEAKRYSVSFVAPG